MLSRREFVVAAAAALVMSRSFLFADQAPSSLDHILLGCSDLDSGIGFVEQHTGVRAQYGGVHPGRGTQNALASLGRLHYLEIIAPDPKQTEVQQWAAPRANMLKSLTTPQLIGWAAHVDDIEALTARLHAAGMTTSTLVNGSRKRDNGQVLHWKSVALTDDRHGLLPFFIEWSKDSQHPSVDAPGGLRLEHFALADPNTSELSAIFRRIGVNVSIVRGDAPQLRARIAGPKGKLNLSS